MSEYKAVNGAGGALTHSTPGAPEASLGEFPPRELVRLLRSLAPELDIEKAGCVHQVVGNMLIHNKVLSAGRSGEIELMSGDWIIELSRRGERRFIFGYNFDLNSSTAYLLCTDKAAASAVLARHNVPHVEHRLVLSPNMRFSSSSGAWSQILDFSARNDHRVVVKPKMGTGGSEVECCASQKQLEACVHRILSKYDDVVISPFYDIENEYRAVMLDGEVQILYRKSRPSVKGDGKSTVLELLSNFFSTLQSRSLDNMLADFSLKGLLRKGSGLSYVPSEGERLLLNWKHNLGTGSKADLSFEQDLHARLQEICKATVKALGVRFCSVDVVEFVQQGVPGDQGTSPDPELRVLEVNSGVMLESLVRQHPELEPVCTDLIKRVVRRMFE